MKKKFSLSPEPTDYILSVHFRNLFYTYGESQVRDYINKEAHSINPNWVELERVISNLEQTYGILEVSNCWETLFNQNIKTASGGN